MDSSQQKRTWRKDYRQPDYWIDKADLHFDLGEKITTVRASLALRRNSASEARPLVLHGQTLELKSVRIDDRQLSANEYRINGEFLTIPDVPERFQLDTEVEIKPQENTALTGLYQSGDMFCTQCEAEGFRRITYFLDRPDVMSRFSAKIIADKKRYPVLLSNGNRIDSGEADGGRHWVHWEDPFPKPAYLFALVAGDLRCHSGEFITRSGRAVRLEIWVEPRNIDRCEHALRSLKKAMRWDEEVYGLEYDLDIYMIVAVNDFNMGAMENKGLNIFNSKYVLCRPDTATDNDYEAIEGVIAHEYFHNWTGNRVTCRDWFQLTLKEGLTVFRDQQFSAAMTSPTVQRIQQVQSLRTAQFAEDQGPMAHPIRPESYLEMNNFYTATVYNKGAEVIRMYHTLLGQEGFRKGMDLYFERHDGQAVTCDDFRAAMADANNTDFSQFERWYSQAGTPTVDVREEYDAGTYTLTLSQSGPAQADGADFQPQHIPIAFGLLLVPEGEAAENISGEPCLVNSGMLELKKSRQSFRFTGLKQRPMVSLLRNFSAPIKVNTTRSREEQAFLMGHDSDPFNRWEAGQTLALELLLELARDWKAKRTLKLDPLFVESFGKILADPGLDGSLKALALVLPSEKLLIQQEAPVDIDALHAARAFAVERLAHAYRKAFAMMYNTNCSDDSYRIDKASIDRRRLKNTALGYLSKLKEAETISLAMRQFETADNMTDKQAALACLRNIECPERKAALQSFYSQWQHDPLVLDKWFGVQAVSLLPKTLERVLALSRHADFSLKNPNRVYALLGAFCHGNPVRFHNANSTAYRFLADKVLELDAMNPQIAARMVSAFNQWRRFDEPWKNLMKTQLERIAAHTGLSKDVYEIVDKNLTLV
ncbi:MAG: aminopeptidase N [Gammaproteobacteria bacterium]|nr:aminopeptidase N [Gammaproteobacteria bacterium]